MLGIIVLALRKALRSRRRLVRRLVQMLRLERAKIARYQKIETETDNALVGSKDWLYFHINSGDLDRLSFVTQYLQVSLDVWGTLGYAYKGAEICNQILHDLENKLEALPKQAYKQRHNLMHQIRAVKTLRSRFHVQSNRYFQPQV